MKEELLTTIAEDMELAKNISAIEDREELLSLEARMISYLQLLQENADSYDYKATQLRGKHKTLKEYIKIVHSRRTELSISDSLTRKGI